MACLEPEGVMEQEQRFLTSLSMLSRVLSVPESLWLESEDGSIALAFVPGPSVEGIRAIRGGTSFGFCLGYCVEELVFDDGGISMARRSREAETHPDQSIARDFDATLWRHLIGMSDVSSLFTLDEVIGCPDCADGGAEWIEVETESGVRRVTFEYGRAPREIAALAGILQGLRDQLRDDLSAPTVILD